MRIKSNTENLKILRELADIHAAISNAFDALEKNARERNEPYEARNAAALSMHHMTLAVRNENEANGMDEVLQAEERSENNIHMTVG